MQKIFSIIVITSRIPFMETTINFIQKNHTSHASVLARAPGRIERRLGILRLLLSAAGEASERVKT